MGTGYEFTFPLWCTTLVVVVYILSILVEVHYYAPAKVTGRGHIVAAT